MKVYAFGEENAPVILLLPGTCCHWKGNFGHVIPLLSDEYRVLCVSYDGFDETERTEFPTMLEETVKIEDYLKANCGGHIRAAYGCSLGGSFVGLLAARGNIRMDYGILGSSDLDQSSKFAAKLQTNLLLSLMFPMLRDGRFKSPLLQKRVEKQMRQMVEKINEQDADLVVFYALKMGEKYRARYEQHFAHPIIHEQDMQHEELLACHPQEWAALVKSIVGKEKSV